MDKETELHPAGEAARDSEVFGKLFEEQYNSILRYCIYHTAQVETARDIAAETFYKALKNFRKYRFKGVPFSAWLYRIARNEIIDFFRSKKNNHSSLSEAMEHEELFPFQSHHGLQEEVELLQRKLEENQAYQQIRRKMDKMPVHYRDVLVLRFVEEKKISEICEILGKKEGTVKSLISRGMATLREVAFEKVQPLGDSNVSINGTGYKESLKY